MGLSTCGEKCWKYRNWDELPGQNDGPNGEELDALKIIPQNRDARIFLEKLDLDICPTVVLDGVDNGKPLYTGRDGTAVITMSGDDWAKLSSQRVTKNTQGCADVLWRDFSGSEPEDQNRVRQCQELGKLLKKGAYQPQNWQVQEVGWESKR